MNRTYTHLEEFIYKLYLSIDINEPRQLDPETITSRLGIALEYLPINSMCMADLIVLDERLSDTRQWQDFGHELCHSILHNGNQLHIQPLFREYQEWKANNFCDHMCIPTSMLNQIDLPATESKAIYLIQKTFNVEYDFAKRRLYQYIGNNIRIG